jgi:hypothetical protein
VLPGLTCFKLIGSEQEANTNHPAASRIRIQVFGQKMSSRNRRSANVVSFSSNISSATRSLVSRHGCEYGSVHASNHKIKGKACVEVAMGHQTSLGGVSIDGILGAYRKQLNPDRFHGGSRRSVPSFAGTLAHTICIRNTRLHASYELLLSS